MFEEIIISKIGYIQSTIPPKIFSELTENIKSKEFKNDYNNNLIGHLKNEKQLDFSLLPDELKQIIGEACVHYVNQFGHSKLKKFNSKYFDLHATNCWINFQEKYEYNPIHHHRGDLVFVIWVKVPYKLEDEYNHPSCKNANKQTSATFQFVNVKSIFSHFTEGIIEVDKSYEGKLIVFHAEMEHTVYPFFTSDEYRISISGNFSIVPRD